MFAAPQGSSRPASFRYRRDELVRIARVAYAAVQAMISAGRWVGPDWDHLDDLSRDTWVAMVRARIDMPDGASDIEHQVFRIRMEQAGWQFGDSLDHELKVHFMLRDWLDLPAAIRQEYAVLTAIVLEMME